MSTVSKLENTLKATWSHVKCTILFVFTPFFSSSTLELFVASVEHIFIALFNYLFFVYSKCVKSKRL